MKTKKYRYKAINRYTRVKEDYSAPFQSYELALRWYDLHGQYHVKDFGTRLILEQTFLDF